MRGGAPEPKCRRMWQVCGSAGAAARTRDASLVRRGRGGTAGRRMRWEPAATGTRSEPGRGVAVWRRAEAVEPTQAAQPLFGCCNESDTPAPMPASVERADSVGTNLEAALWSLLCAAAGGCAAHEHDEAPQGRFPRYRTLCAMVHAAWWQIRSTWPDARSRSYPPQTLSPGLSEVGGPVGTFSPP